MEDNNTVYLSETRWERGVIHSKRKMNIRQNNFANKSRTTVLVRYVISRDTSLNDFGGGDVFHLSCLYYEGLSSGYTTDVIIGMIFGTWCIVKLY